MGLEPGRQYGSNPGKKLDCRSLWYRINPPNAANRGFRICPRSEAERLRATVLHLDDHLIAINKPAGLATQGGSGQIRHVDGMAAALRFGYDSSPLLVHRLDKDTSGILVLARDIRTAQTLATKFRMRDVRKLYWAVVEGVPRQARGRITFSLMRSNFGGSRKMVCIRNDSEPNIAAAKSAVTEFAVMRGTAERAAMVGLEPLTGRTHQLRAHLAEIGHPIIGDKKYNPDFWQNARIGGGVGGDGAHPAQLHLHARALEFLHPENGRKLRVEAPLPPHMDRACKEFGWDMDHFPEDPFGVTTTINPIDGFLSGTIRVSVPAINRREIRIPMSSRVDGASGRLPR